MSASKQINRFFLLFTAPFLGIIGCIFMLNLTWQLPLTQPPPDVSVHIDPAPIANLLDQAQILFLQTEDTVAKFHEVYQESARLSHEMVVLATAQTQRPGIIYDRRITAKLGAPVQHIHSNALDLKLFHFQEKYFKGYAMKVQVKSPSALQMVLAKDQIGESETTLEAVQRYGAIAGINAGGYADEPRTKRRYPLSTTMLNGTYVYGFEPSFDDLTFIGFDAKRKLIGGVFYEQQELDKLNPEFGATFVPVLLKGGMKQTIPKKWLNSRAPRTVVGNYKDDQLLFIVTDGYHTNGSAGATLPELQDMMQKFGVIDAYNLDGGGSSSLIIDDNIVNHPSEGKLRPLATHFLFFK